MYRPSRKSKLGLANQRQGGRLHYCKTIQSNHSQKKTAMEGGLDRRYSIKSLIHDMPSFNSFLSHLCPDERRPLTSVNTHHRQANGHHQARTTRDAPSDTRSVRSRRSMLDVDQQSLRSIQSSKVSGVET